VARDIGLRRGERDSMKGGILVCGLELEVLRLRRRVMKESSDDLYRSIGCLACQF
jgi:hypothetical protein